MRVVAFDVEATGPDPLKDRIVEVSFVQEGSPPRTFRVNPGVPIPDRVTSIHGISDADVRGLPPFAAIASQVQKLVEGATLLGYSSRRFDAVILDAELRRAGQKGIPLDGATEIDVRAVWDALEPRTLAGALKHWTGREMGEAHGAEADAHAALATWVALRTKTGLGPADAARLSKPPSEVDRAGRFARDVDGEIIYNFGTHARKRVRDDLQLLDWMLGKDFPPETQAIARRLKAGKGRLE